MSKLPFTQSSLRPSLVLWLLCAALFLFRIFLISLAPQGPFHTTPHFQDDEVDYWTLTENLVKSNFHQYRVEGTTSDLRRPPCIPILAALVVKIFGPGRPFSTVWTLLQLIFLSTSLGLSLWTVRRMGLEASLWIVFLLSALDLITLTNACHFLSEPLYTLLFSASLALLPIGRLERATPGRAAAVGALLGLSVLTRPIAQYFILPAFLIALVRTEARGLRRWFPAVVLLIAFLIPVGAWMARNALVHKKAFISEIAKLNLCLCWAAQIQSWETSRSSEEIQKDMLERLKIAEAAAPDSERARVRQDFFLRESLPVIFHHPLALPRFALNAVKMIFWGRATSSMNTYYGQTPVGIVGHLRRGGPIGYLVLIWGEAMTLTAMYILILWAIIRTWKSNRSDRWPILILLLPAIYHCALSWGPEATARFRIPMSPWLIVLAASVFANFPRINPSSPD